MIPGFMSSMMMSAALSNLTFINSSSANADAVTVPTGAAEGDIAVVLCASRGATTTGVMSTPSGWTSAFTATGTTAGVTNHRGAIFWKVLTSADLGGSPSFTGTATNKPKTMFVFRPNAPIISVATSSGAMQVTASSALNQTVPAASFDGPGLVLGTVVSSSVTLTSSPGFDGDATIDVATMAYATVGKAPVDYAVSKSSGGTSSLLMTIFVNVAGAT